MLNYYEVLGVTRNANTSDIDRAFQTLSIRCQNAADAGTFGSETKMERLIEAYDVLRNPISRSWLDTWLDREAKTIPVSEPYSNFEKNKEQRHDVIRKEVLSDQDEVRGRYASANEGLPIVARLLLFFAVMMGGIQLAIYAYRGHDDDLTDFGLLFTALIPYAIGFGGIANLLYIRAVYNNHFRPEALLTEHVLPRVMIIILSASFLWFLYQPEFIDPYPKAKGWTRAYAKFDAIDGHVFYRFNYHDREFHLMSNNRKWDSEYLSRYDSLTVLFNSDDPHHAEIIGYWRYGKEFTDY